MSVPIDPQKARLEDTVKELQDSATTPPDENTPLRLAAQKGEITAVSTSTSITPSVDESDTSDNPFADPAIAAHYVELYEKAQYECRHVFDPNLQWTRQEERKLVRKLDWHVCLWAVSLIQLNSTVDHQFTDDDNCSVQCTMFFALQVDRGNLSQAVSDNMLEQLGLTTNGMYS
jgi:hypothetical protein